MNICEHLTTTAKLFPDREAIIFEGQRFTYAQLEALSNSAALQLSEAGITPGDRVALMLPNVPAFVVWYYAILRLGGVAVSVSSRLTPQEVAFIVSDCDAKAFVSDSSASSMLSDSLPSCVRKAFQASDSGAECDGSLLEASTAQAPWGDTVPEDAALILYTSGTTGEAKGATLSHLNVRSNVHCFNRLCGMRNEDRILLAVPLFHCFGQNALLNSAFNVGATLVLQRKFDPLESKQLVSAEQVTQLYGVPTMFQLLHHSCEPADIASVNYCFSAAATLPIQLSQRWQEKFGMPIYEGYGLTETSPFASYNHRLRFVPGSIGSPIDSVEMKIINTDTGDECPPGELGEIAIRGPNVMLGYWNRPQETAAAIRDGWFHSGDIGRMDDEGYFYIVDRVKDMISVGGLKVYPAEIERVLLDHPAVTQAAVVGLPDPVFGEQVVAFVVTAEQSGSQSPESLAADVKHFTQGMLANFKIPQRIVFIDELPRNPSGKVLKTKLRTMKLEQSEPRANASESDDPQADLGTTVANTRIQSPRLRGLLESSHLQGRPRVATRYVQEIVQSLTGAEEIPAPDSRFLDVGMDSLMIVEVSGQVQAEVGSKTEIPATLLFDYPRVCDLANFLVNALVDDPVIEDSPGRRATSSRKSPTTSAVQLDMESLVEEVASMSEEQVLAELMKEIED